MFVQLQPCCYYCKYHIHLILLSKSQQAFVTQKAGAPQHFSSTPQSGTVLYTPLQ